MVTCPDRPPTNMVTWVTCPTNRADQDRQLGSAQTTAPWRPRVSSLWRGFEHRGGSAFHGGRRHAGHGEAHGRAALGHGTRLGVLCALRVSAVALVHVSEAARIEKAAEWASKPNSVPGSLRGRPFLWARRCRRAQAPYPGLIAGRAGPRPLFGLAGGGVCPAATVTGRAVRSYRTFSPLPTERDKVIT